MAQNRIISEFSPGRNDNLYKYTKGGEFSLDGVEYIGEYHFISNVPKTGPVPTNDSKVLQRLYKNSDHYTYDKLFSFNVPILNYVEPIPYLYTPSEQNYQAGFDTRYFVEKIEDELSFAIEIDYDQFNLINRPGGIDGAIYTSAEIRWQLTGRRADIISNNETELFKASAVVPSINYAVRNFLEFARITLV
jgi:hypothetical protein